MSLLFASCYDANEVDDLLHIIAIGVDSGIMDKWRLTIQFPTLKEPSMGGYGAGGGSGQSEDSGYLSLSVEAPSFFTGIDMLNTTISRRIDFMHTEAIIISEELARSGKLGEFIAPIVRFRQIRRSMHLFISKVPAMEFINSNKPLIGTALSKNIQVLVKETDNTGFFPHLTLNEFYSRLKSSYRQPIAIMASINNLESFKETGDKYQDKYKSGGEYYAGELPIIGQRRPEFLGAAVFDGDKMVCELTGDETRLLQMTSGDFRNGYFTAIDPIKPSLVIPLNVREAASPKVKISIDKDNPVIHLKVYLEGDLLAVQSRISYEEPELKQVLEKAFEKQIKDGLDRLMKKLKKMGTDICGFGRTAAKQFLTIQEWEEYEWLSKFKNAEITTEVDFIIRRTGTQLKCSPIISSEGKE